ncbi:MAG TPA: response regulator [Planctomycetota bacterium]|nr:response regulator [Planctomycetota bacterium]
MNTCTILWVEDDADDVLLITRAIQKAGLAQPALARDGREAVDYLSGSGKYADRNAFPFPSIILLDLKLPKMSGFEVLQWIRQHPNFCRIPVIMFTSSRERIDVDRAYKLGANAYLLKSVDHRDLVEALKRLRAFWMDLALHPTLSVQASGVTVPSV